MKPNWIEKFLVFLNLHVGSFLASGMFCNICIFVSVFSSNIAIVVLFLFDYFSWRHWTLGESKHKEFFGGWGGIDLKAVVTRIINR